MKKRVIAIFLSTSLVMSNLGYDTGIVAHASEVSQEVENVEKIDGEVSSEVATEVEKTTEVATEVEKTTEVATEVEKTTEVATEVEKTTEATTEAATEVEATTEATKEYETSKVTASIRWSADDILSATAGNDIEGLSINDTWTEGTDAAGEVLGFSAKYAKGAAKPNPTNGAVPETGCFIKYTAKADGTFTVYEKTGKNKTFYIVDSKGTKVASVSNTTDASTFDEVKAEVTEGETYYAYIGGATQTIFGASFEPVQTVRTWSAESLVGAQAKEDNGLKLEGTDWTVAGPDADGVKEFSTDGRYAKAGSVKPTPNNGAVPNAGCYMTYKATSDGELVIMEKTQKTNKSFFVVDENGNEVAKRTSASASTYDTIKFKVTKGTTYYAYMSGSSANIFQVQFIEGEKTVTVTPWEDVKAPVINKVEVNENGEFEVDYTAVIDENKGAQSLILIVKYEGNEAGNIVIKKQGTTVTYAPLWSGDYSFQLVAERAEQPDKISAEVTYNNYVLAVKKPMVELIKNLGNGKVYLDWLNVEGGKSFNVYYKKSADSEYTEYAKDVTNGHITVKNLANGSYDFKIEAVRDTDGFVATYEEKNFTVSSEVSSDWRFAAIGSAQQTVAKVEDKAGNTIESVNLQVGDAITNKQGLSRIVNNVVNTDNAIVFSSTGDGKISDSEDGFQYYFTMIDPNTENFELTATFELTDLGGKPFDNQTGFGVIATDILGYNFYKTNGLWIKHKMFNSVGSMIFSNKNFVGLRAVSGYESVDATSSEGVTRTKNEQKFGITANTETGATYTFTLKKTDDAYVAECNGQVKTIDDLAMLTQQEDGSICIGVFAARNAGVKVTDIKFETSASKGITSGDKKETITPSIAILSSNTANSTNYEYIYYPNVAGTLSVVAPNGKEVYNEKVSAKQVVRVNVPVAEGKNEVTSVLKVDKNQKLTSYSDIKRTTNVEYKSIGNINSILYVAPNGKSSGNGSKTNPYDLATVVKYAKAGQYIQMMNGTYECGNITIERSISGTADKHIKLVAEDAGKVILKNSSIKLVGDYWDIYGIHVVGASGNGMYIAGNYNTIDMCIIEKSGNTGLQISRQNDVEGEVGKAELLWPSYNLIKNTTSFDNCDAGRNDADGFAAKLTCGNGNKFYGCIAYNNIDDGWDLFAKPITGEIGQVIVENCVTYNNGWISADDTTAPGYAYGEGNGFKLGGSDMYGAHILKNSIAFGNRGKGITSNSCPDCKVYNSISFGNGLDGNSTYNFSLTTKTSNKQNWDVKGLISVTTNTHNADQIPASFRNEKNFIYNGSVSRNINNVTVSDDWFESVDISVLPTRNEDGTIDMHGVLVLTDKCPNGVGAKLVTDKDAISVKPKFTGTEEIPSTQEPSTEAPSKEDTSAQTPATQTTSSQTNNSVNTTTNVKIEEVESARDYAVATPVVLANGMTMNVVNVDKSTILRIEFYKKLFENVDTIVGVNTANGIGLTFDSKNLKNCQKDIVVNYVAASMDDFAEGFKTIHLVTDQNSEIGMNVTIHTNVGMECIGKPAYIFMLNKEENGYDLVKTMLVSEIGNVSIETDRITDIMILVQR